MSKRPSDTELRDYMNKYARALLKASYGDIVKLEDGQVPEVLPKPDVFNAVVNWIRTDAGMEPTVMVKSGLESLTAEMSRGRK